jgi:hypothetical protein
MKKSIKKNTKKTDSGFIVSDRGQWDFPGYPTMIPSNNITMRDVPYPVFGFDDLGYSQMMYPGMDYKFPGNRVYELPMAQVGKENKNLSFDDLNREYNIVQSQVNDYLKNNKGREEERNYRLRLNDTANRLIEQGIDVRQEGYIPDYIKNSPEFRADCISGTCRILNEIGEPTKYYSNTLFQDDVIAGKVPGRTFDYSAKGVVPGDILQFKSDEKSYPYHAYLIQDISEPDEKGNRTVKVAGSSGSGPLRNETYILTSDNKITDEWGNPKYVQTIRRERFDKNPVPNDVLKRRDELAKQLKEQYPQGKRNPEPIDGTLGSGFVYNNKDYVYRGNPYSETIDLKDSKINEMLDMFSDMNFKNNFMKSQNVSSDEYDAIVKNTIGIYGQETKFNTRKEALGQDWLSKSLPGLYKSVGPFQINPKNLKTKRFSREDLYDPLKGAEATATFLAENIQLLRNRANARPGEDTYSRNINQENYLEYLPYLMNDQNVIRRGDYGNIEKGFPIVKGKSDYKTNVDNYMKNLGLEVIPYNISPQMVYEDGGQYNPNTDEIIGFVDDLSKAQKGKQVKLRRRDQSAEDDVLLGPTLQPFEVEGVRYPGSGFPLASGRAEPTMGPIEAMLFAPAAGAMLSSLVPRIGSSLMTGLGRSLPGMSGVPGATIGNAAGLYGGLTGGRQFGEDIYSGYYNSDASLEDKIARGIETGMLVSGSPGMLPAMGAATLPAFYKTQQGYNNLKNAMPGFLDKVQGSVSTNPILNRLAQTKLANSYRTGLVDFIQSGKSPFRLLPDRPIPVVPDDELLGVRGMDVLSQRGKVYSPQGSIVNTSGTPKYFYEMKKADMAGKGELRNALFNLYRNKEVGYSPIDPAIPFGVRGRSPLWRNIHYNSGMTNPGKSALSMSVGPSNFTANFVPPGYLHPDDAGKMNNFTFFTQFDQMNNPSATQRGLNITAGKLVNNLTEGMKRIPGKMEINPWSISGDSQPLWNSIMQRISKDPRFNIGQEIGTAKPGDFYFRNLNGAGESSNFSQLLNDYVSIQPGDIAGERLLADKIRKTIQDTESKTIGMFPPERRFDISSDQDLILQQQGAPYRHRDLTLYKTRKKGGAHKRIYNTNIDKFLGL